MYRMFLLLVLTGAYLPPKIANYIIGQRIFTFNFSFLSLAKFDKIDYPQVDSSLKTIGVESGSTIINNFNLVFVILLIGAVHLL